MPASSSYCQGDVSVLSTSRMMPVPSAAAVSAAPSARRSFSTSSAGSGSTSYTYRTIDRPSYLNSVSATSSYLTSRPSRFSSSLSDYKTSDYKSSVLSDIKPVIGSYRSRFASGNNMSTSTSSSSSYSYTRPSSLSTSNDTDTRERESGYRSRISSNTDSTSGSTSSYTSRRLEGGTSAPTTSRYSRPSLLDTDNTTTTSSRYDSSSRYGNNDSSSATTSRFDTSKYRSSYLTSNDTNSTSSAIRPTTLRSRATQGSDEDDTKETSTELKRPSVAEIRRLFDPVLSDTSRCKAEATPTAVTTVEATPESTKLDSDDESEESSSSESEESSSETEDTTTTTTTTTSKSPRRTRVNSGVVNSDDSKPENEDGSTGSGVEGSPTLSSRSKHAGSERGGLVGLRNIGNTCFMNSVLQCLSNTRPLLEYVLSEGYNSEINTTTSAMKGALIKAFATLLQELWRGDSDERVVNTSAFKSQVQRFAPRFMGYAQQDAQEFLRYLLEGLHEDVNRVSTRPKPILTEIDDSLSDSQKAMEAWKRYLRRDDSKIVDIFVGQLKSTLRCTVCGHCSVTFDPFWDLSLPIPAGSHHGQVRLAQCFDLFTKEEVLDGDEKPTCSRCQTRQKCTKSFSIHKFPKILVLHLKRFSPMERFRGKLGCTVDFPLTALDLNAYASASKGSQACSYNLYGVANHSGTTYSGHYIASCKHPYSSTWHEYNDSRVSSLSTRSVVSSEAYVLFYELTSSSSSTSHL